MKFIELDRTFSLLEKPEDDYSYLLNRSRYLGTKNWTDLLNEKRVVVLASAGSGKTDEFVEKARQLKGQASISLFFPIEELADQSVSDCLSADEEAALIAWKSTSEPGYFFLDSVDEAKLKSKHSFRSAMRKLAKFLGDHLEQAHIFVSCRPSDWDNVKDSREFRDIFPAPNTTLNEELADDNVHELEREMALLEPILRDDKDARPTATAFSKKEAKSVPDETDILVVALDPLDNQQQRAFAEKILPGKIDSFMAQLSQQGLEAYAKRPGDLLQLTSYYEKHDAFGTYAEMTESYVGGLLSDAPNRADGDQLSYSDAYAGAKRLALALVFGKRLTVLTPYGPQTEDDEDETIDPKLVLVDWTPAKIEALLRCGLFAPAAFGRVRFQHRSAIDYLAAQQLRTLLESETLEPEILKLLFPEEFGVRTIPQELRPMVGWLAISHEKIRNLAIMHEPMELVRHGDPRSLSIDSRKQLLLSLADKHNKGDVSHTDFDDRSAWSFASPKLAEDILTAWEKNSHWQFRSLLLTMVELGKLTACTSLATKAVWDVDATRRPLFRQGLVTLKALNATAQLKKIAKEVVQGSLDLPTETIATACVQLYPQYISTKELFALIKQAPTPKRFSSDGFSWRIRALFDACPPSEVGAFLGQLSKLMLSTPHSSDWQRISAQYGYLAQYADEVALRAIERLDKPERSSELIQTLVAIERGEDRGSSADTGKRLRDEIEQNTLLRQSLIWADLDEIKNHESKHNLDEHPGARLRTGFYSRFWHINASDIEWLSKAACDPKHDIYGSDTAFYLWLQLAIAENLSLDDIRAAAKANYLRKRWLDDATKPREKADWEKRQEARQAEYERKKVERDAEVAASWKDYASELDEGLPEADYSNGISGEGWHFVYNLTSWLSRKTNSDRTKAPRSWQALKPAFGDMVASGYVEHLRAFWRAVPAKRRVWKGNSCSTFFTSEIAFAGIGIEADADPDWAKKLTAKEARQAAKHLARTGGGAPDWLPALLRSHPDPVLAEVRQELKREWCSANEWPQDWLVYFADNSETILAEMSSIAASVILNNEPALPARWDRGLRILRRARLTDKQWLRLEKSAKKLIGKKETTAEELARCLAILCVSDINTAVYVLETTLKYESQEAAELIIGKLFNNRDGYSLAAGCLDSASATTRERLVKIVYSLIKPVDDLNHEGAFSPNARDNAQTARGCVLDALLEHKSQAAYEAIRRLANNNTLAADEHWVNVLSKRMVESVAALERWTESEVLDFINEAIIPAKTPKNFFELSLALLRKVSTDFDTADATSKKVLRRAGNEDEVRDWLLERLQQTGNGRFDVFREAQVHAQKRPDLVLSSNSTAAQVAIELKHSDKGWTVKDLRNTLVDQLVERYLRPENRRGGVLVVTRHEKKYWLNPDVGKRMSFGEVIADLRSLAAGTQADHFPHVRVDVVGIDCQ